MSEEFVHSDQPLLLVGGAPVDPADLKAFSQGTGAVVAADGGARHLAAAEILPDAVIGDFDSLDPATRAFVPRARLLHVAEQDSTDFEKCLSRVRAPLVIGLGFLGARVDHTLGALSVLVRWRETPCVLVGEDDVVARLPAQLSLDLAAKTRVSLYPMGAVRGRSTGLAWPIDGLEMAPDGRVGTLNRATGPVTLEVEGPCLILLPRGCADVLIRALAG
ncbi:thiamine diphosphokinase [Pseudaestuariivita sp.]|uniref:thiamine diphosphokinase n=1 Tax=Pseudaestuariivita sp. TaxID=2211669 RepID=UPI004059E922